MDDIETNFKVRACGWCVFCLMLLPWRMSQQEPFTENNGTKYGFGVSTLTFEGESRCSHTMREGGMS